MADEVVGSARIRIEPDFAGFDSELQAGVQAAADQAAESIVAAFRQAAATSAAELSEIGQVGFVDVTSTADSAATDLEAAFAAAATEADTALGTIGEGAAEEITGSFAGSGEEIAAEFAGVGDSIAAEIQAGGAAAEGALEGIGAGAGDALAAEFEGVGDVIGSNVESGANDATASLSALEGAGQGVVENLTSSFEGLGGVIAAVAGAVAVASVFAAGERIASIAGVTNTLIETTGNVANVTAGEVEGLGDRIEGLTGIESELVQEAENVLLTFKNVRNEVGEGNDIFDRAIIAGSDLSAVLGGEITGSALQLGKALQDPIRGMSLLGRAGVTFSADQKELVRTLVEEGDLLSAQKVILGEVEGQVGGAGEAAARASDRIRNSLGNITEEIGLGLLPAADRLADEFPAIVEDLGPQAAKFGELLGRGLEAGVDGFLALTPLLGVTTELLTSLLPILEAGVDLIDAIPDPVLQAAAGVYALNKALVVIRGTAALTASGLGRLAVPAGAVSGAFTESAAAAPKAAGGLRGLLGAINPVTAALAVGTAAWAINSSRIEANRKAGREWVEDFVKDFDLANATVPELDALLTDLGTTTKDLTESDPLAGLREGADFNTVIAATQELGKFREEAEATRGALVQAEAAAEFGPLIDQLVGTGDAMASLRDEAPGVESALASLRLGGADELGFLRLASEIDAAGLSEEGFADVAALMGVEVEELQGFVEATTSALGEFIDTAVGGLPTVATAFESALSTAQAKAAETAEAIRDAADTQAQAVLDAADARLEAAGDTIDSAGADRIRDAAQARADAIRAAGEEEATALTDGARISAAGLTDALLTQAQELADFRTDLATLTEGDFADIAGLLAQQGLEAGAGLADELAGQLDRGNTEILDGLRTANDAFKTESQETIDFISNTLGPQFLSATGLLSSAITESFGSNLDFAEKVRIAAELAAADLTVEGEAIAGIAAVEGEKAARDYGAAFGIDQEVIDKSVAAGKAIRDNAPIGQARQAGRSIGIGLVEGFEAALLQGQNAVAEKSAQLVIAAEHAARKAAESDSPSKLFMRLGTDLGDGIAVGIDAASREVVAAAEAIVADAARAVTDSGELTIGANVNIDPAARSLVAAAVSNNPGQGDTGGGGGGGDRRPIIVERLVLPSTEPELAASAVIEGLVGITQVVGNR